MPFSRQIRSNRTSVSFSPNRPVNTLPLSVRTSWGTPWRPILGEVAAHRPAGGSEHHPRAHHEPGVIVEAGEDLALPAAREQDPADHVHLPQLHGSVRRGTNRGE
jgi:hypothetical protein